MSSSVFLLFWKRFQKSPPIGPFHLQPQYHDDLRSSFVAGDIIPARARGPAAHRNPAGRPRCADTSPSGLFGGRPSAGPPPLPTRPSGPHGRSVFRPVRRNPAAVDRAHAGRPDGPESGPGLYVGLRSVGQPLFGPPVWALVISAGAVVGCGDRVRAGPAAEARGRPARLPS